VQLVRVVCFVVVSVGVGRFFWVYVLSCPNVRRYRKMRADSFFCRGCFLKLVLLVVYLNERAFERRVVRYFQAAGDGGYA
jgi:hypothetical protein